MKHKKRATRIAGPAGTKLEPSSGSAPALCPQCQEFLGRNYPHCAHCRETTEQPIQAAWQTLLQAQQITPGTPEERELAATVLLHSPEYWWDEVEAAMRLTPCATCGGPLGYGKPECMQCWSDSNMFWGKDVEYTSDGRLSRNEHALRVVLRGLGQEKRHSQASLTGWRLFLPFLLHADLQHAPGTEKKDVAYAQAINAWIKAGRGHELFKCQSIEEMYALTRQGRT